MNWEQITKVIYINLEERLDRKTQIENELSVIPENKIMRFNAIKDEKGYIGCTKSHIACLQLAIDNNWDNVMIVEDDAIFVNYEEGVEVLNKLICKPFDVIVLGASNYNYCKTTLKLLEGQTTTCYIVNKTYYKTLLDNFKEGLTLLILTDIYSKYAIDQYCNILLKKHNWFIVYPLLIKQRPGYSNIEYKNVNYTHMFEPIELKLCSYKLFIFTYFIIKLFSLAYLISHI
jgi:glycosyl transferase, family 25